MTSRPLVFALLAGSGLLGLIASAQPWWRASAEGIDVVFSGTDATGGLSQALAVVALVGVLLAVTLAVRGRRVLAVLLAITGAGMAVAGAIRLRPSAAAVRTRVRQVSLVEQFALAPTAWPWVYAGSGLLLILSAVLLWLAAGRWPQRPGRFARSRAPVASASSADLSEDPTGAWQALDAGVDPTAGSAGDSTAGSAGDSTAGSAIDSTAGPGGDPPAGQNLDTPVSHPDVRIESGKATMDEQGPAK